RSKNAHLRFALRVDGPVQEANARMASARIRQDDKRCIGFSFRWAGFGQMKSGNGRDDFVGRHSGRGADFCWCEAVEDHHVLEPHAQLGFIRGPAEIVRFWSGVACEHAQHQKAHYRNRSKTAWREGLRRTWRMVGRLHFWERVRLTYAHWRQRSSQPLGCQFNSARNTDADGPSPEAL